MEEFYEATKEGVFIVAFSGDREPFEYEENGSYYGVYVDIANELAFRLGMRVEFKKKRDGYELIYANVLLGKYDVAFGFHAGEYKAGLFRSPVYYGNEVAIFREDAFESSAKVMAAWKEMEEDGTIDRILRMYGLS